MRLAASNLVMLTCFPVILALALLFLFFLMRIFARRDWLAAILFSCFIVVGYSGQNWEMLLFFLICGLWAVAMTRYGLLTMASALFAQYALLSFPVTLNFSVWYAGVGLAPMVAVLALAVFAFYTSLGGQKVFAGKLLEE
jgi:hypothetical protein